jgi:hypothetical protein
MLAHPLDNTLPAQQGKAALHGGPHNGYTTSAASPASGDDQYLSADAHLTFTQPGLRALLRLERRRQGRPEIESAAAAKAQLIERAPEPP